MADAGIRAAQLADQLRDYLAEWIARDFPGYLISVSQVTLRPDFQVASVWLTFYAVSDEKTLLTNIRRKTRVYERMLGGVMRRHRIPRLEFYLEQGGTGEQPPYPQTGLNLVS